MARRYGRISLQRRKHRAGSLAPGEAPSYVPPMALVVPEIERAPAPARVAPSARWRAERVGLVAWLVVVAVALAWGTVVVRHAGVGLRAAPFYGRWAWHGGWQLLPAAGLGAAVVA